MYAEKFDLTPHIRFHHSVQAVTKAASYEEDGRWMVKVRSLPSTGVSWAANLSF